MGTSESHIDDIGNQGLIPQFIRDLFRQKTDAKAKVIYVEIYRQDSYDLLDSSSASSGQIDKRADKERVSLHIHETEKGKVCVQGQEEFEVFSPNEALRHLYAGSRNRVTGSTLMNATSSCSHAIFTVSLMKTIRISEGDLHIVTSSLTFVDLAGSESLKRTQPYGLR